MRALRKIVTREIFKDFEVPKEFGEKFEMILLPIDSKEYFLSSSVTKEDQIFMKYQEENGFCKNILAQDSEDIWNDV